MECRSKRRGTAAFRGEMSRLCVRNGSTEVAFLPAVSGRHFWCLVLWALLAHTTEFRLPHKRKKDDGDDEQKLIATIQRAIDSLNPYVR
jgi:hypothetical protein